VKSEGEQDRDARKIIDSPQCRWGPMRLAKSISIRHGSIGLDVVGRLGAGTGWTGIARPQSRRV